MNKFTSKIAKELNLSAKVVENTLELLNNGATIPFISRYRKEQTGGLDEVNIGLIKDLYDKEVELSKRKETVIKTITEAGKMTKELLQQIEECPNAAQLEDLYLPFKPKRRTKAQIAKEKGLEPLAQFIMIQRENNIEQKARAFLSPDIKDVNEAIKGAQDIIAELFSEDQRARQMLRKNMQHEAIVVAKQKKGIELTEEALKYKDYFNYSERLKRCSSHRLLAINRGEKEGFLSINIELDDDAFIQKITHFFIKSNGKAAQLIHEAIEDGYKRLLFPAIKNEVLALAKEQADAEAIKVFAENLRQLLLAAPLGQKRTLGIDPGFRTGCKVVCLNSEGNLLQHTVIFPNAPHNKEKEAQDTIKQLVSKYDIEAIAIGNGTASRETLSIVKGIDFTKQLDVFVVSEDGASIYSASKIAREEFPNEDVTVRGAVSIARRLMDPLAELVKIDAKNIGVGQYQHDVDQNALKKSLDVVVESCVNSVGVNLNTASSSLLTYVSGLGPSLAQNIVDFRSKNGAFSSRSQLKKVPRLGDIAFQQCAGFLRIPNGKHPLDNTAVHPESYHIVEKMAKDARCSIEMLIQDKAKQKEIDLNLYVTNEIGLPTLQDIMTELDKPGRDPRMQLEHFEFDSRVKEIGDLSIGMVLPGIITNITNFGVFVDIGVHNDGLVHISQITNRYISSPTDVVKLHQHVQVKVIEVDLQRKRIALSMRLNENEK
ncbi:Tex family protein [Hoylesella nanceiensis]|uniref:Tex family protein n=1 Tax=Hoylesella nanceiensis TaxID=425941 RepID=UPI0028E21507|nr:Tex family protein [Hoylesella nanceiensis]